MGMQVKLKQIKVMVLLLLLAGVFLSNCAPPPKEDNAYNEYQLPLYYGIVRIIDYEAGVVCYRYATLESGGLSCLPCSSTKLDCELDLKGEEKYGLLHGR